MYDVGGRVDVLTDRLFFICSSVTVFSNASRMYGVSSVSALTVISVEFVLFAGTDSPVSSKDAAGSVEFVLLVGVDSPAS